MVKYFRVLLLGCFLSSFLFSPLAYAQDKEAIKIGFVSNLSGVFAQNGKDTYDAATLYLEKIGYKMAGRTVELIAEDEEASPSVALNKTKKLIELNRVNFLTGPMTASSGYGVAGYVESKKVPQIHFSQADDLTQRKRGKFIFRSGWTSSQPSHVMAEYAYNVLGYRKMSTIGMDYAFGWETVGGFQRAFEELGGKIVQKLWVPLNTSDFSPYLSQLRRDVDAVHALLGGKLTVMFIRQYQEYGLKDKIPLNGVGQLTDESVLPALGDPALGVITALPYSPTIDTPVNKEFVKTYLEKYKKTPSLFSIVAYTAISMIDQAVISLQGNIQDPEKVAQTLRSVYLKDDPRGSIRFDSYGNPVQNMYIRKVEKVNGALQNVVVQTYPDVTQFWKFKQADFLKQPVYSRDYPPLKP